MTIIKKFARGLLVTSLFCANQAYAIQAQQQEILASMKKASQFMTETVSYQGGYVWSYLPDFSRRWGEMEAKPTMVWVQPPGTATMGHLFLDAYHVTKDEFYFHAAEQVASALIKGQHPSGGWNYMFDLAGEESLKDWYQTTGANGWRLEEFHHYYGNATFDDGGTFDASVFLLRLYLAKNQTKYREPLYRAVNFVLDSQYEVGGWPQRYPPAAAYSVKGQADYSANITFNDDVAANNLMLLSYCLLYLNDPTLTPELIKAIHSGMQVFVKLKQPLPQPAWALQYTLDLQPSAARSYEPLSLSTSATASILDLLMDFYLVTGNSEFLQGIDESLAWFDLVKLPAAEIKNNRTHPKMVEIGTNKTLYLHRTGSNVTNGRYYIDYQPANQVIHYPSIGRFEIAELKSKYQNILQNPIEKPKLQHGLIIENLPKLPDLFVVKRYAKRSNKSVEQVLQSLNQQGYWPAKLRYITNPYIGPSPAEVAQGEYSTTYVGDKYDTSPYPATDKVEGIDLREYIKNMSLLLKNLEKHNALSH
ncbi:pectate lyase [Catenovulum sp. SX2]|uniref:pectate lyase n=1 Tax=Catenovulum sp. SX2 TaxID=3398614 RepID=UPI003F85BBB5